MTVIVIISDTHALAPSCARQPGFDGDIGKCAVSIVFVEPADRLGAFGIGCIETRSIHEEDVEPAVVVIVEKRNAAAGSFEQILVTSLGPEDRLRMQAGFSSHIYELNAKRYSREQLIQREYRHRCTQ